MAFLAPAYLILLMLIPMLGGFLFWRVSISKKRLSRLGYTAQQFVDSANHYHIIRQGLWLLAITMVIIAMARPTWGVSSEPQDVSDNALIFVLDVSNSMDARDILPSRLDRAKLIINTLIEVVSDVQIGIVVFAGEAYVQLPLTSDKRTAQLFLNSINTQSITQQGTALQTALDMALSSRDTRITQNTTLILISDGENHIGNPLMSAENAKNTNVIIHTIGIGTPQGAEIPLLDTEGFVIGARADAFGMTVITRLDEDPLMQIAQITGGIYQRATTTGEEINMIAGQMRDAQIKGQNTQLLNRSAERFNVFVVLALILLGIVTFIPQRKRGVA
ncbi:MAG: VWA domain-containing protein [Anaerolineae bacterium]|nr:VWA domain-containing protein [Anaerolineae bacterium]